jgi:hypothetical protein
MDDNESEPFLADGSRAMNSSSSSKPGGKLARDTTLEAQDTSRDSQR